MDLSLYRLEILFSVFKYHSSTCMSSILYLNIEPHSCMVFLGSMIDFENFDMHNKILSTYSKSMFDYSCTMMPL